MEDRTWSLLDKYVEEVEEKEAEGEVAPKKLLLLPLLLKPEREPVCPVALKAGEGLGEGLQEGVIVYGAQREHESLTGE